jgi:acetyl-CoA/propionyl-CoA carboxylase biotin carboxyl carrier protein
VRKMRLKPVGEDREIEIGIARGRSAGSTDCRVEINGRQIDLDAELSEGGEGWIRVHGRTRRFFSTQDNKHIQIWLDGRIWTFELQQTGARRAGHDGTASGVKSDITAPMPGTILRVNVAANQQFEAHAPLVVMESMKMEMTLTAPHEGRVKDVLCKVGQLVEMGAVLVRLHS